MIAASFIIGGLFAANIVRLIISLRESNAGNAAMAAMGATCTLWWLLIKLGWVA